MKNYDTLISEKLKCISHIEKLSMQIDQDKNEGADMLKQLEKMENLKAKLDTLNIQLLEYKLRR